MHSIHDITRMNDDDLKRLHKQLETEISSTELAVQALMNANIRNARELILVKRLLGWPVRENDPPLHSFPSVLLETAPV